MAGMFGPPTPDRKRRSDEVLAQARSRGSQAPLSASAASAQATDANGAGASIYTAACANCHEGKRALPYGGVNLTLSTAISDPEARNAANIVLFGVRPVEGERSPIMPGFAASMSDEQIASLLNYLRSRIGNQPAWSDVAKTVEDARRKQIVFLQSSPEPRSAPFEPMQRDKP
jgi:mono/diheme cytochrome c family protein